jgi:hypothetical protein
MDLFEVQQGIYTEEAGRRMVDNALHVKASKSWIGGKYLKCGKKH